MNYLLYIQSYPTPLPSKTKEHDYEHSELIGYQVMVMVEAGQSQEALDHLHKYSHHVVDKLFVQETRGW